ncbi:MAG TPA: 2-oxo acid dehydrogenase subunit E2, partial [Gemmatimonadales bacterium]|nr:2-oxo acid dehydrogenase subunit E2 [Gemmatimonadales bacterium]
MDPNVFETANAGFAQALYEDWLRNPDTVSPEWRRLFESGRIGETPDGGNGAGAGVRTVSAPVTPGPTGALPPVTAPSAETPAPLSARPEAPPAEAARTGPVPIKGPAARLVQNMTESLGVPTATTFREIAVRALEEARSAFNAGLRTAGRPEKASFTHFIAWALVQAVKEHPVMGHAFQLIDGVPHRVIPAGTGLGLAVDVVRKDGSRGLVVPVLKGAGSMGYAEFHTAYDDLVEKARAGRLMPDDYAGATITLTNPGGLGTVASVPRLMAGQGTIIAVGALGYPPEFDTAPPETVASLGLSKVMMLTSTYDHRVIQGAESGAFLGTVEKLLQGEAGFYEGIFGAFGLEWRADGQTGRRAVAGSAVETVAPSGEAAPARPPDRPTAPLERVAEAMGLVDALRTHGHLAARLDPLGSEPPGDPALDPDYVGLSPEVMAQIPASVLRVAVPGATLAEALPNLQATYCGTIAYEVEHVSDHVQRAWLREMIESGRFRAPLAPEERLALYDRLVSVEAFERFLHKAYLGQKRFSIEGVDLLVPMLDLV